MDYDVLLPIVGNKTKKANLRMDVTRKQSKPNLSKKKHSLPSDTIQKIWLALFSYFFRFEIRPTLSLNFISKIYVTTFFFNNHFGDSYQMLIMTFSMAFLNIFLIFFIVFWYNVSLFGFSNYKIFHKNS